MKYERKNKNLLSTKEKCLSCEEDFISFYSPGNFNDRDRICKTCRKKGSRGIAFSEATSGHQTSNHISLTR